MTYRVLQINDPHISDQPPRMRSPSYLEDVLEKLASAMVFAHARGVDAVVITGDLFHRKSAYSTSHLTVQRVRETLTVRRGSDLGSLIPVFIVPGNHDEARGGGLRGQPLLSVVGGHIRLLEGGSDDPDHPIAGIPWRNGFEDRELTTDGQPIGAARLVEAIEETEAPLVFAHAPITDQERPFGPAEHGWIVLRELYGLRGSLYYLGHGHMHGGHEVVRRTDRDTDPPLPVTFGNPGALSRGTIAGHDRDRVPQVALIEYDPLVPLGQRKRLSVEYIALPHRPADEVFLLHEAAHGDERADVAEVLAHSLIEASLHLITRDVLIQDYLMQLPKPDDLPTELWNMARDRVAQAIEEA